jgi:urease accessory protein
VLSDRQSVGPMAVQKILYPEGPGVAHTFVLHPPSGIAGGDHLSVAVQVDSGAHALMTTPGATRWYKANGRNACQQVVLDVSDHASLEWLPSENIFFDQAQAQMRSRVALAPTARFIGWEVMQFGQRQALDSYDHDWDAANVSVMQSIEIAGQCDWQESARYTDETVAKLFSVQGTAGYPVVGTLWAYGPDCLPESDREAWVQQMAFSSDVRSGCTQLPSGLVVLRVLARETDRAREVLMQAWEWLRPWAVGKPAQPLRIWAT